MAALVAEEVLVDRYMWVRGLEWLVWNGQHWAEESDSQVVEAVRQYILTRFEQAAQAYRKGEISEKVVEGWFSIESANRLNAIVKLARGIVERKAMELDADPDMINTPSGVVNLRTGEVIEHDPDLMMTKITSGSYRPGFVHPDWAKALEALPESERRGFQTRIGQGITGHHTPDGVLLFLQGSGENGKSLLTTDGIVPALGDYATVASPKLFQSAKGNEHSEERATLRGKRLLIAEEMTEGRSVNVTALKQIQDVGLITARHVYGRNFSFHATHSLMCTTNYIPVVSETDHGTWRRLALLRFPFTFRKPGQDLVSGTDRHGDPKLKSRIEHNTDHQHDAIVTWAIQGAIAWYAEPGTALLPTKRVEADTEARRADADRILGYWRERLVADRNACILTTQLLADFNHWLRDNGHQDWSKELFGPRFLQHDRTASHGVQRKRTQKPEGLSRAGLAATKVPKRPEVYQGVRFRTDSDAALPDLPDPLETFPYMRNGEKFPKGLARLAQDAPAANADASDH